MWKDYFVGGWLLCMCIPDIRCRSIPFCIIVAGIPAAVISVISGRNSGDLIMTELLFSLIPGIILLFMSVTKKAGYGDGLVMGLLGLIDNGENNIRLFFLSLIFMSFFSLVLLALHKAGRKTRLPYLPFLLSAWLAERIFV